MDIYIIPLPPKAQGSSQKREDYKNHRGRWMATGKVFTTRKGSCTHGLAAVMTTCTRPGKTPNTEEEVVMKSMKSQPYLRSYRQGMAAGTGRASSTHKHPLETLLTARLHGHHLETQRRKWTNT